MTRYTNVGWKRTYHQASSDPNDDQIPRSTLSTPVPSSSDAQFEGIIETPAESNRERPRKVKADSERKMAVGSTPAAIASNEDKTSSSVAEKKRREVIAGRRKPKTKEKTRRAKSEYFFFENINFHMRPIQLHCSCSRQSRGDRSAAVATHGGTTCAHDLLCMSPGWALGQGLSDYTRRVYDRDYENENEHRGCCRCSRRHLLSVWLAKTQSCTVSAAGAARRPFALRVMFRVLWKRPPRKFVSAE